MEEEILLLTKKEEKEKENEPMKIDSAEIEGLKNLLSQCYVFVNFLSFN